MTIVEDFIPAGRRNRPGNPIRGPEYITVHDTGNPRPGANAAAHGAYLRGAAADVPASWHFTVDDTEIRQHIPLDEIAWHAGDGANGPGNTSSLAIEICENSDGDRARAEKNAIWLIAYLLKRFGLGIDRVVPHKRWNGKNCPHLLLPRWDEFIADVRVRLIEFLTPIMGEAVASLPQAREWLRQRAPDWVLMADLYWSIAPKYDVRPDVALAQAAKETGFFRFGGLVKPEQNNFCGLAATGVASDGNTPLRGADSSRVRFEAGVHGAIFADRATGVEAHVQHLYAYATTKPLPENTTLYSPRFALVRRGSAQYVELLGAAENPAGAGWAYPGVDYGKSIVRDYLQPMIDTRPAGIDWQARALAAEGKIERIRAIIEA